MTIKRQDLTRRLGRATGMVSEEGFYSQNEPHPGAVSPFFVSLLLILGFVMACEDGETK